MGGTIKATLHRERRGAHPERRLLARACRARRCRRGSGASGLQEIGLPYAADAAMTRHMARFLRQQAATAEHGAVRRGPSGLACPTHILFNGGVLQRGPDPGAHPGRAECVARRRKACRP